MCAINPRFKKRMIFDFYTSHPDMTETEFKTAIIGWCLDMEINMNNYGAIRCHVKETEQEAT